MKWTKLGLVWGPAGDSDWARTHATCPTPLRLSDGRIRVFVQCRDARQVGRIGWVDLDGEDPTRCLQQARQPALDIGQPGHFDDNGVFPTSVLQLPDGRIFLYYVGFELCHHIRYRLLTGLAISEDQGLSFRRVSTTPILERSAAEPHIRGGPFVLAEDQGFHMWYVAGGSWEVIEGKAMPIYDIRRLSSKDGMAWGLEGEVVLQVDHSREHGFGRPFVIKDSDGSYRMYYSVRRRRPARYRLGFARSRDGRHWQRDDDSIGLDVTPGSWDADSIEYAAEFETAGQTWLLYNGDDFGAAGFGLARKGD